MPPYTPFSPYEYALSKFSGFAIASFILFFREFLKESGDGA